MPPVALTAEEWALLADEPAELMKVYLGLKRNMDYETATVGLTYRISEQKVRELLSFTPCQGRRGVTASRRRARYALERLQHLALLRPQRRLGPLVFFLPYGTTQHSVQNKCGQGTAKVRPEARAQEGPQATAENPSETGILYTYIDSGAAIGGHISILEESLRCGPPLSSFIFSSSPNGEVSPAEPDGAADCPHKSIPDCPHQSIIALYHELLPNNPAVKTWTDARRRYLRSRWREDAKRQSLAYWRRFFKFIGDECPFLTGQRVANPERGPFLPDLEWLVRPRNFARIIEGQYRDRDKRDVSAA